MLLMPESPLWLSAKGLAAEATEAALWLKNETILDSITKPSTTSEVKQAKYDPRFRGLTTWSQLINSLLF